MSPDLNISELGRNSLGLQTNVTQLRVSVGGKPDELAIEDGSQPSFLRVDLVGIPFADWTRGCMKHLATIQSGAVQGEDASHMGKVKLAFYRSRPDVVFLNVYQNAAVSRSHETNFHVKDIVFINALSAE